MHRIQLWPRAVIYVGAWSRGLQVDVQRDRRPDGSFRGNLWSWDWREPLALTKNGDQTCGPRVAHWTMIAALVIKSVWSELPEVLDVARQGWTCDTAFDEQAARYGMFEDPEFEARAVNWTPVAWRLWSVSCGIRDAWHHLACAVLGHDLVDGGSTFGPDSGTECLCCRRCGWSWSHCYY